MKDFSISVQIDASPEHVWAVMSDVERWHEWTPTITSVRRTNAGPFRIGARARIHQPRLPRALTGSSRPSMRDADSIGKAVRPACRCLPATRSSPLPAAAGDPVGPVQRLSRWNPRPADRRDQQALHRARGRRPEAPRRGTGRRCLSTCRPRGWRTRSASRRC